MNLKELSGKLGLSQTTVSRALNGYPEVSEATRLRVEAAAKRYNYRPNSRAQGLATGKAMVIGHVISSATRHEMVNPIFGDFFAGAALRCADHGYDMIFTYVDDGDEPKAYEAIVRRGTVDGIVLQAPRSDDPRISILNALGVPFIVHGRSTGVTDTYSWVDVNNLRSFRRATEFLIDLGHRRIALINGLERMDFAKRRRDGYLEALTAAGIGSDPDLMRSAEMTEAYGYRAARDMLRLSDPPTALLVSSMISAIGVRRAIEDSGQRLGKDVSVITHDDQLSYLRDSADVPVFTATRSSVREAGEILADMLIAHINHPSKPPETRLLEAELVIGMSTGPAPVR